MVISDLKTGRTHQEFAALKAVEIGKLSHRGTLKAGQLEINVREQRVIEVGTQSALELEVQATQDGVPVGFGPDGTVDIERVRFFNAPVLIVTGTVPDVDDLGNPCDRALTAEDPVLAIRQALTQVIAVIAK